MQDNGKFEMWMVVELMGHQQIAGKVTEQPIAGQGFVRVDVPKTQQRAAYTKFFSTGAVYAMTPVEQSVAQAMAEGLNYAPVETWRMKTIDTSRQISAPDDHPDHDSSYPPDSWDDEPLDLGAPPTSENVEKALGKLAEDKLKAAEWARELLEKDDFVIVDTETTGFDDHDEIVQVGIIDHEGKTVLEQLIKPEQPILNSRYHGITDEMVQDAPGFPEVFEQIKVALQDKTFVAYNLAYDTRMINQVCDKHNLPRWGDEGECVMEQYAQFHGEWNDQHGDYRWKKLREALAAFDLTHEDFGEKEHDACTDARATLAVIKKMAEYTG